MKTNIDKIVSELLDYAINAELITPEDEAYAAAGLLSLLSLSDYTREEITERRALADILEDATDYALSAGLIEDGGVVRRDLFDTKIMGIFVARPSEVNRKFAALYERSPEAATDYFYSLAKGSNYIRTDRIARDLKWTVPSEFGEIDITVNLSKPEKDPKAIAAAKLLPPSGYPRCALCHENEGFAGDLSRPARQNLRQIPFDMAGSPWFLQYSPYVYYNEHCIALSARHEPMKIDGSTFPKLLGFVEKFPHYFIGSNADLPIVGGSILSHDHMQGGRYTFAMERAECECALSFEGFEDVTAGIVRWPLAVIRLSGDNPARLAALAEKILTAWRAYSDPEADIISHTGDTPHNTVTPIARRRGGLYELDLALRNNRTSEEYPDGIFHPHSEHHNIKKENIGLIEVMGLAVLPARLRDELQAIRELILSGKPLTECESTKKHAEWFSRFEKEYSFTEQNTEDILRAEVGKTFVRVLEDAGVYKCTESGRAAFKKFIDFVNNN